MIAVLPRVAVDHCSDQFVDGTAGHPRAARASRVEEACPEIQSSSPLVPTHPVVHGLSADMQQLGDLRDLSPLGEPEQGLGPTSLLGQGCVNDEVFEFATLPVIERKQSHRFTLSTDR
jgi:hypothetical protein